MNEISEELKFYIMIISTFILGLLVGAQRILTLEIKDVTADGSSNVVISFGLININPVNANDNSKNVPQDEK